jgi:hypothetical protein
VPHKRLIKKKENYGITNPILSWIQDFLTRRYQQVSINGETLNRKEVTSGIPQRNTVYISSNNKTLNARLLARVINGLPLHVMEQPPRFFALAYRA